MIPVGTGAQLRSRDAAVIGEVGVPGVALMELASHGLARAIVEHHGQAAREGVVVVCGPGNNGGDGYGAARWLHAWGVPVSLLSLVPTSHGDADIMRRAAKQAGVPEVGDAASAGVWVDALFGTGLTRPLQGRSAALVQAMNRDPAPVVAADIPSGIHADTGAVLGCAVVAATTVTFGVRKLGFHGEPGASHVGRIEVVDIGLGAAPGPWAAEIPEAADLRWPARDASDHKTRSGHLLVVAGSTAMAGAAVLCCRGALAAGAGLVTLATPRGALARLGGLPPEVMVVVSGEGHRLTSVPEGRWTAIVAGPGLGGGVGLTANAKEALATLWADAPAPVLFDADALPAALGVAAGPRLITPHPGEAGRILGRGTATVQADRFTAAEELAIGCVALLKGRNTLIAEAGRPLSINPTGGPVLATGGSGDVLAGVAGALLARGLTARDAARSAAWVHGRAGDRLAARRQQGWTASDVAHAIPDAVADLDQPVLASLDERA